MTDTTMQAPPGHRPISPRTPKGRQLLKVWVEFRSMRTALVLLLVLACGSILGSLFPQRPNSPDRVEQYLRDNPTVGPVLERLGLFDVFGSPWFTATYVALLTALVGCLVPRGRALLRLLGARPPRGGRLVRYQNTVTLQTPVPPEQAVQVARGLLAANRYRLADHSPTELAAEKGYLREIGSLLFHVSFLLLLIGLAIGKSHGFRGQTTIVEGASWANTRLNYDIFNPGRLYGPEQLPPFTLRLEDFTNTFHPNGVPRQYASQLTALDQDGQVTQSQRVTVNRPMTVEGIRIFQSDYAYAPWLVIRDRGGRIVRDGPVDLLRDPASEASTGAIKLPGYLPSEAGGGDLGLQLTFLTWPQFSPSGELLNRPQLVAPILVVWPWAGDAQADLAQSVYTLRVERMVRLGDRPVLLRPGQRAELPGGGSIQFRELRQATTIQLARDPGAPVAGVAAALLLAGLLPSLYVRRRRVWAHATEAPGGSRLQLAGLALQGKHAFKDEFAALTGQVEARLEEASAVAGPPAQRPPANPTRL